MVKFRLIPIFFILAINCFFCSSVFAISDETEVAIGREADFIIRQKYGMFENASIQRYVEHVGLKLVAVCARPNIVYHFTILDDDQINGMAVPGGYVYITRGLLESIENEGQLAASLAHEIAHIAERHGAQQMEKDMGFATLMSVAGIIASSASGKDSSNAARVLEAVNIAYEFSELGYGKKLESEADLKGTEYLLAAGYDPESTILMLNVIQISERDRPHLTVNFLRTHPKTTKRVDMVREHRDRLKQDPKYRSVEGNFYADRYKKSVLNILKAGAPKQTEFKNYYKYYNPPQ